MNLVDASLGTQEREGHRDNLPQAYELGSDHG